jgi:hypothetical protein
MGRQQQTQQASHYKLLTLARPSSSPKHAAIAAIAIASTVCPKWYHYSHALTLGKRMTAEMAHRR